MCCFLLLNHHQGGLAIHTEEFQMLRRGQRFWQILSLISLQSSEWSRLLFILSSVLYFLHSVPEWLVHIMKFCTRHWVWSLSITTPWLSVALLWYFQANKRTPFWRNTEKQHFLSGWGIIHKQETLVGVDQAEGGVFHKGIQRPQKVLTLENLNRMKDILDCERGAAE